MFCFNKLTGEQNAKKILLNNIFNNIYCHASMIYELLEPFNIGFVKLYISALDHA